MKKHTQIISLIAFTFLLFGIGYFRLTSGREKVAFLNGNGKAAIGVVSTKVRGVTYFYTAQGESFSRSQRTKPRGLLDGETFKVIYDVKSPDISMIDFSCPIFDTLDYDVVCVDSYSIINGDEIGLISFNYNYRGQEYTRYLTLNYSNFPSHGPFKSWVKRNYPQQSYLVPGDCR